MSAYIMTPNEFNTIVSYFITPVLDDQLWLKLNGEYTYMGLEEAREVAKILFNENVRSVESRYNSQEANQFRFNYIRDAHRRPVGNIAGALDCLEYQSCETDDYRESAAYEIITAMRKHLLKKSDDYTWGIE